MHYKFLTALLFILPAICCSGPLRAQSAENVLLLVNENSEDSKAIARYYAEKRNLPKANLCPIRTTESEKISRQTFEHDVLEPAAAYLKSKNLQDQILYIVTTRGLPLIIEGDPGPTGDLASVDSELAQLYRYMIFGIYGFRGRIENPYFAVEFNRERLRPFVRQDYDIYLITRITGATLTDATALIDRALQQSSGGAFYFDLASVQQSTESDWTRQAAAQLKQANQTATIENTGKTLDNLTGVQGYLNQGMSDTNIGDRVPTIQWNPGAIAAVLDKASAASMAAPAMRYIKSGLTGFGGYVADPTLDGYLRPQILFPAYAAGYNLAESFWAATRYMGWRQVIIGDPLASPNAKNTARQRDAMTESFRAHLDAETALPEHFARRRQLFLVQKYNTSKEAVALLLKAESAANRADFSAAASLIDKSLEQDPYIVESQLLKASLLERQGDFAGAFSRYRKTLELGRTGRELYTKLARLAFYQLKDPKKAEPYALWLYQRYGRADLDLAAFYADVELQCGKIDEARMVLNRLVTENNPAPAYALAGLGRIYFDQGKFDLAKDFLAKALARDAQEGSNHHQQEYPLHMDAPETRKLLEQANAKSEKPKEEAPVSVTSASMDPGGGETREARVISKVPIDYPRGAGASGNEGVVVVSLLIDEMGQVMKGEIVRGPKGLGEAVLKSVLRWRFDPRLENGRPVPTRQTITITFKLKKP